MQSQPAQPPKQATYTQPTNPITQPPQETDPNRGRSHGDNVPTITRRTAASNPSNPRSLAESAQKRESSQTRLQNVNVDLEYGVELQPNEGEIANAVEGQSQSQGQARAQAGAHAGPVGAAEGPGHPGFAEERDLVADMPRKRAEHDRVLGEQSLPGSGGERMLGRQRMMEQRGDIDVKKAVEEGTGDPVAGDR